MKVYIDDSGEPGFKLNKGFGNIFTIACIVFEAVQSCRFSIVATVVDKSQVSAPRLKKSDSFYQLTIIDTLKRIDNLHDADIFLDGKSGKNYRNRSAAAIRHALNSGRRQTKNFRMANSKNDPLIQLADMVAGAIRAKYSHKPDYTIYFQPHIKKIQTQP